MKYRTYAEIQSIRPNTKIWACAYNTNKSKETMALKCFPIKGIIKDKDSYRDKFFPYKANGDLKKSASVNKYSRCYADTY